MPTNQQIVKQKPWAASQSPTVPSRKARGLSPPGARRKVLLGIRMSREFTLLYEHKGKVIPCAECLFSGVDLEAVGPRRLEDVYAASLHQGSDPGRLVLRLKLILSPASRGSAGTGH
jgi:hypothetical protein